MMVLLNSDVDKYFNNDCQHCMIIWHVKLNFHKLSKAELIPVKWKQTNLFMFCWTFLQDNMQFRPLPNQQATLPNMLSFVWFVGAL